MLDPALCDRPLSQWIYFKQGITYFLENPALMLLGLGSLTIALWIWPKSPWNQRLSLVPAGFLLLYLLALAPPVVNLANRVLVQFLPRDSGSPTDAIVVLGRGEAFQESRAAVAAQLWQAQRAPEIFVSGRGDAPEIVQLLRNRGIPQEALDGENCSQTTAENAQFTAQVLQPLGVKQILLVTDSSHMLRSLLTFRSFGFQVIPHLSETPPLPVSQQAMLVFREYAGMVAYALKGRFLPQQVVVSSVPEQISP